MHEDQNNDTFNQESNLFPLMVSRPEPSFEIGVAKPCAAKT